MEGVGDRDVPTQAATSKVHYGVRTSNCHKIHKGSCGRRLRLRYGEGAASNIYKQLLGRVKAHYNPD